MSALSTANFANELLAKFKSPPARSNRFLVDITLPTAFGATNIPNLICMSTSLPGYNFDAVEINQGKALTRKIVNGATFSPISLTFILTEDYDLKKTFDDWQKLILNTDQPGNDFKYIGFYSDYIGAVAVSQTSYSDPKKVIYQANFLEAYPISVGPVSLDMGNNGATILPVAFQYYDFEIIT